MSHTYQNRPQKASAPRKSNQPCRQETKGSQRGNVLALGHVGPDDVDAVQHRFPGDALVAALPRAAVVGGLDIEVFADLVFPQGAVHPDRHVVPSP